MMLPVQPTRILFDFFGTLVDYSSSRTTQGYPKTWATVRNWGVEVSYERMLAEWSATCLELDRICEAGHREYSMTEAAAHFLPKILGRRSTAAQGEEFVHAYLDEWNAGVRYPPGIQAFVRTLAERYQLAVVTNTHWPALVPQHLITMGLADAFAQVITSVDLGRRQPTRRSTPPRSPPSRPPRTRPSSSATRSNPISSAPRQPASAPTSSTRAVTPPSQPTAASPRSST